MKRKSVLQHIEGKARGKVPVIFFKEGNKIIAYSPAIDLSTCGDTEEQASKRFSEAAGIFFNEIIKMGTIDDVLAECGWEKFTDGDSWSPPVYKHKEVPISEGVY
jgi:hypothetical protein